MKARVQRFWRWFRRDLTGPLTDDEDYETGMAREWPSELDELIARVTYRNGD